MDSCFVHLHVHSEFSLVDGLLRLPSLVKHTADLGMPAIAVTDQCNLFSLVKFYQTARNAGVKPIIGADLWIESRENSDVRNRMVFLCRNESGYKNLSELITRSYLEGQSRGIPAISYDWLGPQNSSGLIVLSGGIHGDVGAALIEGNLDRASDLVSYWRDLLGDAFYLELTRTGRATEGPVNDGALDLAEKFGIPVVATNDVRFLRADEFDAHEARVCIHDGRALSDPRRTRNYSAEQYLRTPAEMIELFADVPQAIENSVAIAQRCTHEIELGVYHLPVFPVDTDTTVDAILRRKTHAGLEAWRAKLKSKGIEKDAQNWQTYDARLDRELQVIVEMGFSGYFLIVADFIQWAKDHKIPVGPGRGSGAGSLAAFVLRITEIDPLEYDLLFERFLNPERVSMPDFDVDFCMERRDEVIDYVADRYGRDKVAQIITYGTMAAKAVVRDVGRVLSFPYGFVDQLAKLIPFDPNMTLTRALDEEPLLKQRYDAEDDVRAILDLALTLEGLARNAGKHAGGVVIAPTALTDFMPLYCEQGSTATVTQLDMGDVETVGLVKFDFLGLRTLTILDWSLENVNEKLSLEGHDPLDIADLPLQDAATFKLIQDAQTTAVFQLESRGMKELIKRLRPDRFEDLIALVALFRPGPLQSGMVDDYVDRKHGRATVRYLDPKLEPILKPTYGVILYQEQVMQIAQELAGYTLGAADLLRRAMGKKKAEEMAKQRQSFLDGSSANGIDVEIAAQIFDLMEKFAGYGFNKSHSAAYALIAYQTAWLKAHYPAAFMAAVLSSDMDSTDKVVRLIEECRSIGLEVARPNINSCNYRFTVADDSTIYYGLGAVKGLGEAVIQVLADERTTNGSYKDIFDLCCRNDSRKINKRALEALIKSGALDCLGASRRGLASIAARAIQIAEQQAKAAAVGQSDMFGLGSSSASVNTQPDQLDAEAWQAALATPEWPDKELLTWEKETLGLYLSGHPIDRYDAEIGGLSTCRLAELKPGKQRRVIGLISGVRMTKGRRGQMAIVTLDDKTARAEITIFSKVLETCLDRIVNDRVCVMIGDCNMDEYSGDVSMKADRVLGLDEARNQYASSLRLTMDSTFENGKLELLKQMLSTYTAGDCPVSVEFSNGCARARLRLGDEWRVAISETMLEQLHAQFGETSVAIEYH
ncbi:MAG: DNA polymerase-3 subunit alpha [Gammaproteobacteria bacterium]